MKATGNVHISSNLPSALLPLWRLALNLRWSWRSRTRELFRSIDPELWEERGHNPKALLRKASMRRLEELAADPDFMARVDAEIADLDAYCGESLWYQRTHRSLQETGGDGLGCTERGDADPLVAYFSMEFGITPSLPIYSGGLGVLAGDHLKSASDLGVPIIGVGLLYKYGYFTQTLSRDGWQQETYTAHSPKDLPIEAVLDAEGDQLTVEIGFPNNRTVHAAVWRADVGRAPLLLLDTNIERNDHDLREITDRLYGGDVEHRIKQELVLGVGGVRAVDLFCDTVGIARPRVAHLNEGHAGFSGLERISQRIAHGDDYAVALAEVRASTVFTTHTPVPAGIDRFDRELVRRYLDPDGAGFCRVTPGVPVTEALALGAEDDVHRFNMAHMGLRLAQRANGVSKLHGAVSREMFRGLYPHFDVDEVPIGSVTNGVHLPTWTSVGMTDVIDRLAGDVDIAATDEWAHAEAVTDDEIWRIRTSLREELVDAARDAIRTSWEQRGLHRAELGWTSGVLDPDILTIGFARRVSTYKRLTLMLQDPQRLRALLLDAERPVQLVIAGKAHPADVGGKQLMQQMIRFADDAGVRHRIAFLPDYDIELAQKMVAGCDIWMNNPVRPQEASGTSGMKAVMNGALTLSISDGWWDELRSESNGWTIPTVDSDDHHHRDSLESRAFYDLVEHEIAPEFYERAEGNPPARWMRRLRTSLTEVGPAVSATRMVRDYVDGYYRPADDMSRIMLRERGAAHQFVDWRTRVEGAWRNLAIRDVRLDGAEGGSGEVYAGRDFEVSADVDLGILTEDDVALEVVFGKRGENGELIERTSQPLVFDGDRRYKGGVVVDVPGDYGFAVRAVPRHTLLVSPAELGLVRYAE